MWHKSQAYNELTEPISGINAFLSIFTFLAVAFDLKFSPYFYILIIVSAVISLGLLGILIVRAGIVAYVTSLGNGQNPELTEILKRVKKMEQNRGKK